MSSRPPLVLRALCPAALALAATLILASPALACPTPQTSQAFALWGDYAPYAAAPGGLFEDGLSWSVSGAAHLVASDNPFQLSGPSATAVRLQSGDAITSPSICIDRDYPTARLMLRADEGNSKLKISVLWTADNGKPKEMPLDRQDANQYASWAPSGILKLGKAVPKHHAIRDIRLRIAVDGRSTAWRIDDVYIDPFKRG